MENKLSTEELNGVLFEREILALFAKSKISVQQIDLLVEVFGLFVAFEIKFKTPFNQWSDGQLRTGMNVKQKEHRERLREHKDIRTIIIAAHPEDENIYFEYLDNLIKKGHSKLNTTSTIVTWPLDDCKITNINNLVTDVMALIRTENNIEI